MAGKGRRTSGVNFRMSTTSYWRVTACCSSSAIGPDRAGVVLVGGVGTVAGVRAFVVGWDGVAAVGAAVVEGGGGACRGVGTVLSLVPHVAAAGVVVEVAKGEYHGVGGPDELVGCTSGGGTGLDERDRWVAIGGE